MAILLSSQDLSKSFGAKSLFKNINLGLSDGDRTGLIGPNGAGKSTFIKILAGVETADHGDVIRTRGLTVGYLPQKDVFDEKLTVSQVLEQALKSSHMEDYERDVEVAISLGTFGFENPDQKVCDLSGGWKKRLAIARSLITHPTLVLMDEPTNHLDLEGILWLEKFLERADFSYLIVSHDRYFLENVTNRVVELNPRYPEGCFQASGTLSDFLSKREEFLAGQEKQQETLANQVKREVEWLRSGTKARTTKSYARIKKAYEMQDDLSELKTRNAIKNQAGIEFSSSGRRTKRLIHVEDLSKSYGEKRLIKDLTLTLSPGLRVGLVGMNGTGKTTLIKLLTGEVKPDNGTIDRAPGLKTVVFDQTRKALDQKMTLKDLLAPSGNQVVYQDRPIHVASWAKRFLFRPEQLQMPAEKLSGGEQARVLIAQLMVKPADVLILDEPTNDLDIPTLEVLEESLLEFPGALVLVTHDRYLLDRVSNLVLGLHGDGRVEFYANYHQWEAAVAADEGAKSSSKIEKAAKGDKSDSKRGGKKMSYNEQREWDGMESKIAAVEEKINQCHQELADPAIQVDAARLQKCCEKLEKAQAEVDHFYARWGELGEKLKVS